MPAFRLAYWRGKQQIINNAATASHSGATWPQPERRLEMQTASAPKDSDQPGASALNWRQRKKATMRRQQEMQRRQEMVAGYIAALGGADRISPIQMADIERAADLVMLARDMRAAVRAGTARVSHLTTLESTADRAVRRLNLPPPGSAAPTISQYLAAHEAEHEHEKP
jgi:hypothetical protein